MRKLGEGIDSVNVHNIDRTFITKVKYRDKDMLLIIVSSHVIL